MDASATCAGVSLSTAAFERSKAILAQISGGGLSEDEKWCPPIGRVGLLRCSMA